MSGEKSNNSVLSKVFFAVKFGLAVCLVFLASMTSKNLVTVVVCLAELLVVFLLSQLLTRVNKVLSTIVSGLLLLVFSFQQLVVFFANSYLNRNMVANVRSFEALGSKGKWYILFVLIIAVICFLPSGIIKLKSKLANVAVCFSILVVYALALVFGGLEASPFCSLGKMIIKEQKTKQLTSQLSQVEGNRFANYIGDSRLKDEALPDNPNIILIFVEGMSSYIIDDSRNITPNISDFRSQSLSFENYYNHTFATYHGIQGQLFSGYSDDNLDENHLLSLQDILSIYGYNTAFINPEPNNVDFSNYLISMDFDEVLTVDDADYWATNTYMTDEVSYQMLFDTACELNSEEEPFLLAMYSFGTHTNLNSTNVMFGNGDNEVLNRFYNMDNDFGAFFEAFENSELAENTIIILTSDHATYCERYAVDAQFEFIDNYYPANRIPFIVYYDGIVPEEIDVNGRNSLSLAPTILDYLDIEAETSFLGNSLFGSPPESGIDTYYFDASTWISSANAEIEHIEDEDVPDEIVELVYEYFVVMKQTE